jgi:hypothetical protein
MYIGWEGWVADPYVPDATYACWAVRGIPLDLGYDLGPYFQYWHLMYCSPW